jgi:type IV pilus assembly protein PilY1
MNARALITALGIALAASLATAAHAQGVVSEDFTSAKTDNAWYFFNGACLTASTAAAGTSPGQIPGCTAIKSTYYNENLTGGANGTSGGNETLPDTAGNGALRFTNGYITDSTGGYRQNGAIVSSDTFPTGQGVQITFKTVTYRGDSGGAGGDGADGISFYLMDGAQPAGIGAWGGSLGYSCSNSNDPHDGLVGAYIGLGIDEYGNFLNGTTNMSGFTANTASGDNSALGYGYKPNRIGLRGAGNISWGWLNAKYGSYYPLSKLNTNALQQDAVKKTCSTGFLWDYSSSTSNPTRVNSPTILDYAPIPNAYKELPSSVLIANEYASGGYKRGDATPIVYNLKITQDGLLSFGYSINGGAWQSVISKQSIAASNGALPAAFRFGFAGSTGGSSNIHEILCFKAQPLDLSASSTGVNEKQSAKIETGTQAYFAFYDPNDWTGRLTANDLYVDAAGALFVRDTANWDASCVLTGVPSGKICPTTGAGTMTAQDWNTGRNILAWKASTGIPLRSASLASTQKTALNLGDPAALLASPYDQDRLNYLRGDRTNEVTSAGAGRFRARASVLGDIVDSSPTWVGPPSLPYTAPWKDRLYLSATAAESAASAQSYVQFIASAQTRPNVVYLGANDGLLHGFRTGAFGVDGKYTIATTPNDGREVLAYMPGAVLGTIHNSTDSTLDFSNTQYGHNFYVNATPGTGDLFYSGRWHTWLVGGLGPGGAALYALDVTDPSTSNFVEGNAASIVIGEWSSATLTCTNVLNCRNNLGNTYGVPQVRRFHNGSWGVIFGNGLGSSTGDAGIYVMVVDPSNGAKTFYYLSTGKIGSNGIAYVSPADLDGDHITDYVYAGDLLGNVWRFDLTSSTPASWAAASAPLFTTPSGQPITTRLVVASGRSATGPQQMMIAFGTGQKTPFTNTNPVSYASGTQSMYGIWDWNFATWNASSAAQYSSLSSAGTGLTSPYTVKQANLQQQTFTVAATTLTREIAANAVVCWKGSTACASGNNKFGWFANLPGTAEQVVFNPQLLGAAFVVNTAIPASNSILSCTTNTDTGFTYAMSVMSGGAYTNFFPQYRDTIAAGVETDATGTSFPVMTADGSTWLVYQTVKDIHQTTKVNLPPNTKTNRLTWIELR